MSGLLRAPSRINLTYILIALNVVAYAYTSFLSGNPIITSDEVLWKYGQNNALVMQGWFFQLFTAMFVHVNSVHLIGNMFFLLIFGLRAEELFHVEEYVMIYLLTGLTGNLLTLLLGPYMVSSHHQHRRGREHSCPSGRPCCRTAHRLSAGIEKAAGGFLSGSLHVSIRKNRCAKSLNRYQKKVAP